jgi:hypothetical protein
MPFFNRDAVIRTLDGASSLDDAGKIALEVPLMTLLSASILGELRREIPFVDLPSTFFLLTSH